MTYLLFTLHKYSEETEFLTVFLNSIILSYNFRPRWASVRVKVWGSLARDAKRLLRPQLSEGEEVSVSHCRAFRGS